MSSYQLVIVESASKSKTIQKYLNSNPSLKKYGDFKVVASLGHIVDLPQKELGIDVNTWELSYVPTKMKIITELKSLVKNADNVFIASDPDREGEAIAWHLERVLKIKNSKRVLFHEITPKAIEKAILEPGKIDYDMVYSQETRRALDRLVGFKVSPLLWKRFVEKGLSAGRVQSVVLKNIVERYKNYEKHTADKYWTVEGDFILNQNTILDTELYSMVNKKKVIYMKEEEGLALLKDIMKYKPKWNISFNMKETTKKPSAPYTTSTLQQDMYENHSIPAKDTMKYAQKLYEDGLITYMRTDSVNLSESIKEKIKEYIINQFGEKEYQSRKFKNKISNAQEAHECIRPTNIDKTAEQLGETYTSGHIKVYNIIWKKTVASQMETAKYIDISYNITTDNSDINKYEVCFCGKKSYLVELGFLKVWKPNQELEIDKLQQFKQSIKNITDLYLQKSICKGNITKPDGLYNESSIIKWMEKEGIGRPSTYAAILDKLFSKYYISKGSNPPKTEEVIHYIYENDEITSDTEMVKFGGNEKDRYIPSNLGVRISEYLNQSIPNLMDYKFTSNMETLLDSISKKETTKEILLTSFYKDLSILLEKAKIERKEYQKLEKKDNIKNTQEGGGEGEKDNVKKSNLINSFGNIELQNARYGPALYNTETKKYISVTPFMEWTKKSIEDINDKDVKFLTSLPIKVNNELSIEYGRYGLYIKHNGKNKRLDKKIWNRIYEGCYTEPDIISNLSEPSYQKKYPKKK